MNRSLTTRAQELARLFGVGLPVEELLAQQGHLLVEALVARPAPRLAAAFFVLPVRGDAEVRRAVHLGRADLDLQRLAGRPDDFCVQGLVAVGLRFGDVVVEAARHGHPDLVDDAQRVVAVGDGGDDHAQGDQVVDLAQVQCPASASCCRWSTGAWGGPGTRPGCLPRARRCLAGSRSPSRCPFRAAPASCPASASDRCRRRD